MPKHYYFVENDQQFGPYTTEELKSKSLKKSTLVWTDGMTEWDTAENVDELNDIFISEPPPLPVSTNATISKMKHYSNFTTEYVQDICNALNSAGFLMIGDNAYNPDNFQNLTEFLKSYILDSSDIFNFLNQKGLINRGRCPYTGQQIGINSPNWSYFNRTVYMSPEGCKIMQREDDEIDRELFGEPLSPKKPKKKATILGWSLIIFAVLCIFATSFSGINVAAGFIIIMAFAFFLGIVCIGIGSSNRKRFFGSFIILLALFNIPRGCTMQSLDNMATHGKGLILTSLFSIILGIRLIYSKKPVTKKESFGWFFSFLGSFMIFFTFTSPDVLYDIELALFFIGLGIGFIILGIWMIFSSKPKPQVKATTNQSTE